VAAAPSGGEQRANHLEVGGKLNRDAAWYYPQPKPAARHIADYVAF